MFLDLGKYHYLIINKDIDNEYIELRQKTLDVETEEKLRGIITDKNLNFQSQIMLIITTSNQNLSAFVNFEPFMTNFNKILYLTLH